MSSAQIQNQEKLQQVLYEIKKVIVGQDHLLERVLIALLAQGHLLVEGVPGLAKTLTIKTLAQALQCKFRRVQFTPDLLPADLLGTRIFNQKTGEFTTWLGPIFTNLLLADEINRTPAKVQSALLEVMQERQVSIGGETFKVEEPFLVMATQNPIETEGTYPLPEAQVDRFMMKVLIDYPNEMEEFVVVERMTGKLEKVQPVLTVQELLELRKEAEQVFTDPALIEYAVKLTVATRDPERFDLAELKPYISYGASPRSSINLVLASRALAYLRGRSWVIPQDIVDVALDVMRHRLVLSYEALAEGVSGDTIIKRILETVSPPREVLKSHVEAAYKS